jgi:hypothetical protein
MDLISEFNPRILNQRLAFSVPNFFCRLHVENTQIFSSVKPRFYVNWNRF